MTSRDLLTMEATLNVVERPLLTIAVPTYNGAKYIEEAICSVLNQIDQPMMGQIEILVQDNASTDSTSEVVARLQQNSAVPIRHVRNEANVGFDRNIVECFKNAHGQFVWLLADDDRLKLGALNQVIPLLITQSNLGVILLNFEQLDRDMGAVVDQVAVDGIPDCGANEFLLAANGRYGQVSSLIFNNEAWREESVAAGIGTNFMHVYGLMKVILKRRSCIVSHALVDVRMGSISTGTSGDSMLGIALDMVSILREMPSMGHDVQVTRRLLKDAKRYTSNMIPVAKIAGIKHKMKLAKRLVALMNGPSLWIKHLPVVVMPDQWFNVLYPAKKRASAKLRSLRKSLVS